MIQHVDAGSILANTRVATLENSGKNNKNEVAVAVASGPPFMRDKPIHSEVYGACFCCLNLLSLPFSICKMGMGNTHWWE